METPGGGGGRRRRRRRRRHRRTFVLRRRRVADRRRCLLAALRPGGGGGGEGGRTAHRGREDDQEKSCQENQRPAARPIVAEPLRRPIVEQRRCRAHPLQGQQRWRTARGHRTGRRRRKRPSHRGCILGPQGRVRRRLEGIGKRSVRDRPTMHESGDGGGLRRKDRQEERRQSDRRIEAGGPTAEGSLVPSQHYQIDRRL
mmetsp:Transcript_21836/g.64425  ORF Transcript_21836/g.64425 Transcript_21836/m.64425 type:complete len:200 (+) Transcript_21836:258-857(+)